LLPNDMRLEELLSSSAWPPKALCFFLILY
jgi:hypothetical protein